MIRLAASQVRQGRDRGRYQLESILSPDLDFVCSFGRIQLNYYLSVVDYQHLKSSCAIDLIGKNFFSINKFLVKIV